MRFLAPKAYCDLPTLENVLAFLEERRISAASRLSMRASCSGRNSAVAHTAVLVCCFLGLSFRRLIALRDVNAPCSVTSLDC